MHWCNQVPAGLYAHGCYEKAHTQLFKLFRRLGENGGLGPRYRGEVYQANTGEIVPDRFPNYPSVLHAVNSVIEGVFGLRWTAGALNGGSELSLALGQPGQPENQGLQVGPTAISKWELERDS